MRKQLLWSGAAGLAVLVGLSVAGLFAIYPSRVPHLEPNEPFDTSGGPRLLHVGIDGPVNPHDKHLSSFAREWQQGLLANEADPTEILWHTANRWMAHNGREVMEAVLDVDHHIDWKGSLLARWMELDSQAAYAWVLSLPEETRRHIVVAALGVFATATPHEALALANGLEDIEERRAARLAVLGTWSGKDPRTAWQESLRTPAENERQRRLLSLAVMEVWIETDVSAALAELLTSSLSQHRIDYRWQHLRMARWAQDEPQMALDWLWSLPRSSDQRTMEQQAMFAAAMASLAIHMPHAALATMETIGDELDPERQNLYHSFGYRNVIEEIAKMDTQQLVSWFESQPDPMVRVVYAADVARWYALAHPSEAREWVRNLRHHEFARAMWAVVDVIAGKDSAHAARLVQEIDDPIKLGNVIVDLLPSWAESDPEAAKRWIDIHLTDDCYDRPSNGPCLTVRERGYGYLFHRWASKDIETAVDYLDRIPGTPDREAATRGITLGMFSGRNARLRVLSQVPLLERLYASLPTARRPPDIAYFLYRLYEKSDPVRAARYRAESGGDEGNPWDLGG